MWGKQAGGVSHTCLCEFKQLLPSSRPQFTCMRNGGHSAFLEGWTGDSPRRDTTAQGLTPVSSLLPFWTWWESSLSCPFPPPSPAQGSRKSA